MVRTHQPVEYRSINLLHYNNTIPKKKQINPIHSYYRIFRASDISILQKGAVSSHNQQSAYSLVSLPVACTNFSNLL
jgi:hypothetical protein